MFVESTVEDGLHVTSDEYILYHAIYSTTYNKSSHVHDFIFFSPNFYRNNEA